MAGADNLSVVVDLMILLAVAVFYTGVQVWFNFRHKDTERAYTALRGGAAMIGILGGVLGLLAIWGEMNFPLPGAYNVFFFDPLLMLAFLTVSFALAVWLKLPTNFVGILGVITGSGVIYYGIHAYQLGLTQDPFETLLMYGAFGGLALLTFIPTFFVDWFVVGAKFPNVQPIKSSETPENPRMWTALLGFYLAVAFLAGLAALLYGFSIAWSHL
jgi:putative membrane protein